MRFAVESWDPSYGVPVEEAGLEPTNTIVDASVEVEPARWQPIWSDASGAPQTILFIDGVRRIDSRVWITEADAVLPGVCATVAAGAVRCEQGDSTDGAATIEAVLVERGLYTAASSAEPIMAGALAPAVVRYDVHSANGSDDAALYGAVHHHMTELEKLVSDEVGESELIVFDGPLRGRNAALSVGYIKTHQTQYLEPPLQAIVTDLQPGQRTPIFAIGDPLARWSWYLRLPGPLSHPMSGVVRLELPGLGEADSAAARADAVSVALPRYASEPHKESRAPQNLYPISGLEFQLRRRLGHSHVLEKALRVASVAT